MTSKPAIFISAVSKELHTARDLVAKTLLGLGYDPKWQDIAPTETGDLRAVLRRWVDDSQAVIQLVGRSYGSEPSAPDHDFGRCSYTQYEAHYARSRGKKVWYLFLDDSFPADACEGENDEHRLLQQAYRERVKQDMHLFHPITDSSGMEATILKLRDDLARLRRRFSQWAALVIGLLIVIGLGVGWVMQGQRQTDLKVDSVLQRYRQMEQALIKLADTEIHAKQLGEKLTPEALRQRAYTVLENELGIAAGTLSKELPAFALELYTRSDTTLLMRARAAYALNKFEEAEKLFLESAEQDRNAQENAQQVADKLRKQRIEALIGAGQSAEVLLQYVRSLEHFRAASALTSSERDPLEWADVQWGSAYVNNLNGQYHEAEVIYRQVNTVYQRMLGAHHPDTLAIRNNLAITLSNQDKNAEAELEHREVLAIKERILGPEHTDTLGSRLNLANVMVDQGKYADAELEYRAVLFIMQRVLGAKHHDTLFCRHNLATLLLQQGNYAEAEKEYALTLVALLDVMGAEHPDTLKCETNYAVALGVRGLNAEAEVIHREVLAISQRVLGTAHPETLSCRHNLALALLAQNKFAEAEQENRSVLAIRQRVLGGEHRDTLKSRLNLAITMSKQGKFAEAEQIYREVLAILPKVQDFEHSDAFQIEYNLALCLKNQAKLKDALEFTDQAAKGLLKAFGADHPFIKSTENLRAEIEAALKK